MGLFLVSNSNDHSNTDLYFFKWSGPGFFVAQTYVSRSGAKIKTFVFVLKLKDLTDRIMGF